MALLLGAAVAAVSVGAAAYGMQALRGPELDTVDARFSIRGAQGAPPNVTVVAIDDDTFSDLRVQFPFPRSVHARVVDRLRAAGARVIAYDVQFTEPTEPAEDEALIEAVARHPRVVLSTTEVDESGATSIFGGDEVLREIGARPANTLLPTDPGGVLRRFTYEVDGLETFGVAAAELHTGRPVDRRSFEPGGSWIDYRGPRGTVDTVSFSDVHEGRVPRSLLRGRVVVVGSAAPSLQDVHPTSFGSDALMAGAEVQANVISTILEGFQMRAAPAWLNLALVALLGALAPLAALRLRPLAAVLAAIAGGLAFSAAAVLAFSAGTIVSFVYPMLALAAGFTAMLGVESVLGAIDRAVVRDRFARFVPEAVVDEVLARDDLRLGGQRRTVTVMFTDIRGFTTFSETRPPDQVIEVLNRYLTAMSNVILDHGGTLLSFIGDGIIAVFGAPVPQDDHADQAVAAAREMTGDTLDSFNDWLRAEGISDGFRMGAGLNSGDVMVGNVGSERRLEYTAIGDTVNTAARLEALTKGTPNMVLVADSTRSLLVRPVPDLVHVDEVSVRGRQASVSVWSFEAPQPVATSATGT